MPMDKDNLEILIIRKITTEKDIPKTKEYQMVVKSMIGKLQVVDKLPKHWAENGDHYFAVNTQKRWYRILWGTRDHSLSIKAHGELTISMINPLRFLNHILPDGLFKARDLQLFMSDQITNYLRTTQLIKLVPEQLRQHLNEELETSGIEITSLDLYKGAH